MEENKKQPPLAWKKNQRFLTQHTALTISYLRTRVEAVEVKNTNYMGYARVREKEEEEEEERKWNKERKEMKRERKKTPPSPSKVGRKKPRCELEFPKWEGKTKSSQRGERGKEQKVKL